MTQRRYAAGQCIGSGSFGSVYAAIDREKSKNVAVKISRNIWDDPDQARRIVREVRLLRVLDHPSIMGLIDCFSENDNIFVVSELMQCDISIVVKNIELYKSVATPSSLMYIFQQMLSAIG